MVILNALPLVIVLVGGFFIIRTRAFFLLHPIRCLREIFRDKSAGGFRSLCLALAGTLGVGNIVGVAVGISTGGPGSVFWLLVSAPFSCILKYSEVALSSDSAIKDGSGMIGLIRKTVGRVPSFIYASLCLALSLTLGSALQANAISESLSVILDVKPSLIALPLSLLVALAVAGGTERIERAVSVLIPISAVLYIGICLISVFGNIRTMPLVIKEVISGAFTTEAGIGGAIGILTSRAVNEGFARGLLSNEAGAGSSTLAHARACGSAHIRGLFGIAEVLFDTVVICGASAAAILASGAHKTDLFGIALVERAFTEVLGGSGGIVLFLLTAAFAVSTVLCQYFYGGFCARYLFGIRARILYFPIFLLSFILGFFISCRPIITMSDLILFLMTLICSFTLIKNSDRVKALSELGSHNSDMRNNRE